MSNMTHVGQQADVRITVSKYLCQYFLSVFKIFNQRDECIVHTGSKISNLSFLSRDAGGGGGGGG